MNVIYLTLIISTIVAIVFFVIFIFSLKRGQYDDTYTPSVRMLFDDELVKDKTSEKNTTSQNTTTSTNSKTNKSET
ncbi:MAG: cbb3-type cytochrome oxidase assembly protein CcoS [Flavobacteriaceae bacterium]|nr:cbb3-type cytochrome oxidase assembly protein CcoS [Flavobacteriaceae bacterium]